MITERFNTPQSRLVALWLLRIFSGTTNRLEHLDSASLRRFDMKLLFDFLLPRQTHDLLVKWCHKLGIAAPLPQHSTMLESMEYVTPGDLAAAARRHRFQPFTNAEDLIATIRDDCELRKASSRHIGFL